MQNKLADQKWCVSLKLKATLVSRTTTIEPSSERKWLFQFVAGLSALLTWWPHRDSPLIPIIQQQHQQQRKPAEFTILEGT